MRRGEKEFHVFLRIVFYALRLGPIGFELRLKGFKVSNWQTKKS